MKRNLLFAVACLLGLSAVAQQDPVLMRINGKAVFRSEFEARTLVAVDSFVNFKLKVAAAESAGMDTTRAFREKLAGYRAKLAVSYLTDADAEEADARQIYDKMKAASRTEQVQVMQLFMSLPQTLSATRIRAAEVRMDSLYAALQHSTDAGFATYVAKYSADKKKSWVARLQTPQEFEDVVFALQKGEISRPFYTPQGLHIVKVTDRKETLSFEEVQAERHHLLSTRQGVDKRTETLVRKLKSEYAYTPDATGVEELLSKGETGRPLFTFDGRAYSGSEFKRFAASCPRGTKAQLDAFVTKTILETENARLEAKYPTLRRLIQVYRDDLLLSQITAQEIETKATTDEAGLSAYFKLHKSDYDWTPPRYQGIVLHCADKKVAKQAKKLLKKLPEQEWERAIRKTFNAPSGETVLIEQGVFIEGNHAVADKIIFEKGDFEPSKSHPFIVVWGQKRKGPDSYQEVRESLTADYRRFLDTLWIKRLRAVGKVEINQEVLKTVNNH